MIAKAQFLSLKLSISDVAFGAILLALICAKSVLVFLSRFGLFSEFIVLVIELLIVSLLLINSSTDCPTSFRVLGEPLQHPYAFDSSGSTHPCTGPV